MLRNLFFKKAVAVTVTAIMIMLRAYAITDNADAETIANNIFSSTVETEYQDIESIREKSEYISEFTNLSTMLSVIKSTIIKELGKISSVFISLLALILLSAVFESISESFSSKNIFIFVSLLITVLITLHPVTNIIELTKTTCDRLSTFMLSFIPAISAMSAAGGNAASATAGALVCSSGLTILEIMSERLLIPATKICISLCAIGTIGKETDLSPVISFIRSTSLWISGVIMTVFCGVLSLQTFISAGADSLAIRGMKFTAAKLIPVAGGMVSESLKTVVAGAGYVKSVAGTAAITYIIYAIMPTLCGILAVKLLFYLSGIFASLSGQKELQTYLNSVGSALNLLYAVCAVLCASFIIMLAIFIKTSVSV